MGPEMIGYHEQDYQEKQSSHDNGDRFRRVFGHVERGR